MNAAVESLLAAMPRCCACGVRVAVIVDPYRWPLCESCWWEVPGSDTDAPLVDIRTAVYTAMASLAEPPQVA